MVVEIEMTQEAWGAILADPMAEEYQQANVIYDGDRLDDVAVRVKGNSSLNSVANNPNTDRFSFKLDTNRYVDGQKLRGVKKLNFNNGFKDPSMIREHIGYKLATELGLAAPRTAFVDLTVAGNHMGLYTVVEQVDDDFVERWFPDPDGDLYKPDWPDGHLMYQGDAFEDYGGLEIKTNEDTSDHSAFLHLVDVINHGADEDVEAVVHTDSMLRYMALNTALVNLDSYTGNGHNFYCYEMSGAFVMIPWDLNEAFGNFTCGCNRAGIIEFMMDEPTCGAVAEKPLVARMLAVDEHKARYHELLQELVDGPFTSEVMNGWIDEVANLIRPTVEADTTKFFSTAQFEQNLAEDVNGSIGLKAFVAERSAAIRDQLQGAAPSSEDGNGSCGNGVPGGGGGGPGGGPGGGGGNPKCPDEICDGFEQSNCNVCPQDCEDDPTWQANCG
jgi:spore coat protein CotH